VTSECDVEHPGVSNTLGNVKHCLLKGRVLVLAGDHSRGWQNIDLALEVLASSANETRSVGVPPGRVGRMVNTSVGTSPEQLCGVSLGPRDRWETLDPLFDRYGKYIGMERSLGQGEHGFQSSGNVRGFTSGNTVHTDDMRVVAEVGVGADIGNEGFDRSIRLVQSTFGQSKRRTRRTGG
jgi:hypothetical protein